MRENYSRDNSSHYLVTVHDKEGKLVGKFRKMSLRNAGYCVRDYIPKATVQHCGMYRDENYTAKVTFHD